MDSNELKPCPWCSGTDLKRVVDCGLFHILCIGCGAQGPTERLEVAARAEWNRRPSVPPVGERERRIAEKLRSVLLMFRENEGRLCGGEPELLADCDAILSSPAAPSERRVPSVREVMAKHGIELPPDSGELDRLCRPWVPDEADPVPSDPKAGEPKAWVNVSRLHDGTWYSWIEGGWAFDHYTKDHNAAVARGRMIASVLNLPLRVAPSVKADRP